MTSTSDAPGPSRLTPNEWLICFVAELGFPSDIYELLMLPLIVGPALLELLGAKPGSPEFNLWVGWLFWLPAVAGGIFGLLGGYLTDLFGRPRVLVWSLRRQLQGFGSCSGNSAACCRVVAARASGGSPQKAHRRE